MKKKMNPEQKILVTALILILGVIANSQVHSAFADVPDVLSVEPWTSGADTILNITVRHALPTSSHYVDSVEVDIDGAVQDIPLTPPQSAPTFIVQYNMGEVTDTPTVQARAYCTFHGWSSWSEPVVVPEFSTVHLFLILTLASSAILLLKVKTYS